MKSATGNDALLIVLEGGEGAGKSTQSAYLAARLRAAGRDVVETYEPGATKLGLRLREILLDPDSSIDPWAEALIYAADRAQHVAEVLAPALDAGSDVISDRFVWSSLAYQGAARGLGVDAIAAINKRVLDALAEPVWVVIDIDPEIGLTRVGEGRDRIEAESLQFHERVREAFLDLAVRHEAIVVDANADVETVAEAIWMGVVAEAGWRGVEL